MRYNKSMLIDDIRALQSLGTLPDPWQGAPLAQSLVVRMDEIHALVQALGENVANKSFDDLVPNVAPLAPAVWCEVSEPSHTWAAFLISLDLGDPAVKATLWADTYARHPWTPSAGDAASGEREWIEGLWARTRWAVAALVPLARSDGTLYLPQLPFQLWLDGEGRICFRHYAWNERVAPDPEAADEEMRAVEPLLNTALVGVCFAHCKGVVLHDHEQPRQQRRATERAGRPALVTYKTIDIAPVTRILHADGHIHKTGITQALHLCRGHFASYTHDAPLFGKYTGTFYRPLHVRGSLQKGAVLKDYRVHAAAEAPSDSAP